MSDSNEIVLDLVKELLNKQTSSSSGLSDIMELIKLDYVKNYMDKIVNQKQSDAMDTSQLLLLFLLMQQQNQGQRQQSIDPLLLMLLMNKDKDTDKLLQLYQLMHSHTAENNKMIFETLKSMTEKQQQQNQEQLEKLINTIQTLKDYIDRRIEDLNAQIEYLQQSGNKSILGEVLEELKNLIEAKKELKKILSAEEPYITQQGGINWDKISNTILDILGNLIKGSTAQPPAYNPPAEVPSTPTQQITSQVETTTEELVKTAEESPKPTST
jgi:tetratricopeptide (TPR) repeat protein